MLVSAGVVLVQAGLCWYSAGLAGGPAYTVHAVQAKWFTSMVLQG